MDQPQIAGPFCLAYYKGLYWVLFYFLYIYIYINDPASLSISLESQDILYAVNLLLCRPISYTTDYCALRPNIAYIEAWSLENCLKFNVDKCKCMVIIDNITSFKYLGLICVQFFHGLITLT